MLRCGPRWVMIFSSDIRACFSLERAVAETAQGGSWSSHVQTPPTLLQLQLHKNQFRFIKLTFEHLYCHLHDRLRAAEPVGGALHHFPKGSRAQDATFWRHNAQRQLSHTHDLQPCVSTLGWNLPDAAQFQLLTQHKSVPGELPSGVVGKLHWIHVDVLVSIRAYRLNDPPADFISRFLSGKHVFI